MGKAMMGVAELAGAAALVGGAFLTGGADLAVAFAEGGMSSWGSALFTSLAVSGISMEAGAIASALSQNRSSGITVRQPAAYRQVVYGTYRVGGVAVYMSSTGSGPGIFNQVIVVSGHQICAFTDLWLDGRKVYWDSTDGNTANHTYVTDASFNFGGWANGTTYTASDGITYNFGSNVFCSPHLGDQTSYDLNLTANDPNWAPTSEGSPILYNCGYFYLHVLYDSSLFPQMPEVRVTVQGKALYDPRTEETAFSDNWALVVLDVLLNAEWGYGCSLDEIDIDNFIAAANICDEQVDLAAGGTESRYTFNYYFDTSSDPGDILQTLMNAAAARISNVSGQWMVFPAAWVAASLSFDENSLVDDVSWTPYRSARDLFNHVSGSYNAPNYPYSVVGNYYDANGFSPDGTQQDNFELAYQPTSIPPYAMDTQHGYATDPYTTADGNIELWNNYDLKGVVSIGQAQRILKIMLMRNRQQGSGTLSMMPWAWQAIPCDVIEMTFSGMGWSDKVLEVTSVALQPVNFDDPGDENGQRQAPYFTCQLSVQETDPIVYDWSTTEELSIYDISAGLTSIPSTVAAPSELTLTSGAATAVVAVDGIVTPRIQVSWTAPADAWATEVDVQYKPSASSTWIDAGPVAVANLTTFISGVVAGQLYDVRICALRDNGNASAWVEQDDYQVSLTYSQINSLGIQPGLLSAVANDAAIDSIADSGSATIRIYGAGGVGTSYDVTVGSVTTTYVGAELAGLEFATTYYVVVDTSTGDCLAFTNYADALADGNYIVLGTVTTVSSTGTGGVVGGGGVEADQSSVTFTGNSTSVDQE